jgi:hypothetical protein
MQSLGDVSFDISREHGGVALTDTMLHTAPKRHPCGFPASHAQGLAAPADGLKPPLVNSDVEGSSDPLLLFGAIGLNQKAQ